jgi:hypothetical protein
MRFSISARFSGISGMDDLPGTIADWKMPGAG